MTYSPDSGGKLLGSVLYDPATRVIKSGAALLAMTALDTTNLRVVFVAPASGKVFVRLACTGATQRDTKMFLGVLDGATVKLRRAVGGVDTDGDDEAVEADGLVVGLTPGTTYTWDAAYGIENTGGGPVYGGPNDTTAANANGAILFEIWEVVA